MTYIALILSIVFLCLYLMTKQLNTTKFMLRLVIFGLLLIICSTMLEAVQILHFVSAIFFHTLYDIKLIVNNLLLAFLIFNLVLIMREPQFKYVQPVVIVILLFIVFGYITAIKSETLFFLYLSLEVAAFSSYALIGMKQKSLLSNEGAIKYFLGTSISSVIFLLAISILYAVTGTTNISQLANLYLITEKSFLLQLGCLMIIISLLSKLAIAPFHWFTVDAYQSAPLFVTSFLMTVPKIALLLILSQIFSLFSSYVIYIMVAALVIYTFFQQSIQAFGQVKLRRFVVFTMTVNNAILLIPLLVAPIENSFSILPALISYFIPLQLQFYVLGCLRNSDEKIRNIFGLKNSILILIFFFSMISFIGIPVLGGFLLKYFVLIQLLSFQELGLIFLFIVMTVLPVYYYLRLVQALYFVHKFQPLFTHFAFFDAYQDRQRREFSIILLTEVFGVLFVLNIMIFIFQLESTLIY